MNSLSLLLVEDDPDDIELMNEALKDAQIVYSIQTISQGDKVLPYLELCKKFPDIIILDLNLPKLHGRDVLRLIKTSERFKIIPVAILTTASSQNEKDYCLKEGANKFLTKPSTVEGFNQTINTILNIIG
jgi:CheY-like chemotaxis protein